MTVKNLRELLNELPSEYDDLQVEYADGLKEKKNGDVVDLNNNDDDDDGEEWKKSDKT